jgi:hypothetical protein
LTITSIPISPDLTLLGDVSTPIFRPLIPLPFQKPVFDHVHSLGHPGIRATSRLLSSRFVWSHMSADIAIWSRQCMSCQKAKIHKHITPPATAIPIPERRFSHVHVDIVGHCHLHKETHTFLPWLTALHDGQRPSLCPPSQPLPVLMHFVLPGLLDLAFLTQLLQTEAHSLHPHFGHNSHLFCKLNTSTPQLFIHNRMV